MSGNDSPQNIIKRAPLQNENQGRNCTQCHCKEIAKDIREIKVQIQILVQAAAEQKVIQKQLLGQHNNSLQLHKEFPLDSVENLVEMDEKITPETKQSYIKTMRSIIYAAGLCKNLKFLISTEVVMAYNIEGVQGKKSLKDLSNFYGALIESITTSEKYPGSADEQLRKAIQLQKKREFKAKCLKRKRCPPAAE